MTHNQRNRSKMAPPKSRAGAPMLREPGITSYVIPPHVDRKNERPIAKGNQKVDATQVGLIIERKMQRGTVKYFELLATTVSMTSTGAFQQLTTMTQGPAQFQRIADTIWMERIDVSYNITTANVDIFNLARVTLMKWKISSALASPTILDVFTNWSNAFVLSYLNFENRKDYAVFHDLKFNMSGIAASPTINSQHYVELSIPMNRSRVDFNQGATTGIGNLFLFVGSDSTVTPFPVFNGNFRIWYYDAA